MPAQICEAQASPGRLAGPAVTAAGRYIWCYAPGTRCSARLKSPASPTATWQRSVALPRALVSERPDEVR
jgi:hypothetical protein